jgi:hypothetical protein
MVVTTAKHLNRIEELTGSNREYRMRYKDFIDFLDTKKFNKSIINNNWRLNDTTFNMVSLNWWMFNSNVDWIYIYSNNIISCIFYIGGICFY